MKKSKAGSAVFVVSLVLIAIMAIWSVALNESFTKVSNVSARNDDLFSICYLHGFWKVWKDSSWRG